MKIEKKDIEARIKQFADSGKIAEKLICFFGFRTAIIDLKTGKILSIT